MQARTDLIRPEHIRLGPQGPELFGEAVAVLQSFALIEHVERGGLRQRRDYQLHQLRQLFDHVRAHSPFWQARIPAGATSLGAVPLLRKAELRAQIAAEGALPVPPEHGEVGTGNTSGSTSEPLTFHYSRLHAAYNLARYSFDDVVSDRRLDLPLVAMTGKSTVFEEMDRWPTVTGTIWRTGPGTVMPIGSEHMEEVLRRILEGPGGHIATRPAIAEAIVLRARDRQGAPPPIAEILTYGELVTPWLREEARAVLGARIADRYSAEEVGPIAFECRRVPLHYHVASSNVVVEVMDEKRRPAAEGKVGDIVVTGLHCLATPIIRYDIGDRAALVPRCPCGHAGPTLKQLAGRRRALLRLPDGRLFFLRPTAAHLEGIAPVLQWRAFQTAPTALLFEVVAERPLSEAERAGIAGVIRKLSSPAFEVTVRQVPAIDWGPGGKRELVVNLIEDTGR